MTLRKAIIPDINYIRTLLNHYADKGLLLPRPLSELYVQIRDYLVIEGNDKNPVLQGVCGLGICWEDLAEIKSLAIHEDYQGKGLGSRLVESCLQEARLFGIGKVFVLTYVPDYFIRFGFQEVSKSHLPQKIWADCLKCTKFPNCDEVALILKL
ncbi:MAG: N-acetyltransferase [Desulfatiglandaceae bacterium]|jgi:amino-acid N-acetyltransferase